MPITTKARTESQQTHGEGALLPSECSLDDVQGPSRVGEWIALRHVLRSNSYSDDGSYLYLRFDGLPDVANKVRQLAAQETQCCKGASFVVEERGDEAVLTIGRDASVMAIFAQLRPGRSEPI